MIRPRDAFVLAYTKLRTHKVRTGLTVGISGILFGLILAMVFVVQGVFDSIDRFDKEGLSDRSIVMVSRMNHSVFSAYDHLDDASFIHEVEEVHKELVAKKTAAATKHNITYSAAMEDPSPVVVDVETKKKTIPEEQMANQSVIAAVKARKEAAAEQTKPFSIDEYLAPYGSATVLPGYYSLSTPEGTFTHMKSGKEDAFHQDDKEYFGDNGFNPAEISGFPPSVISEVVTESFVTDKQFDASKGEIPAIFSLSQTEGLLDLEPLKKSATTKQRLDRLDEVRRRVGEVTVSFCYRNEASNQLLVAAMAQQEEMKRHEKTVGYQKPSLIYAVPAEDSCGAITVASDTRTAAEKRQAVNEEAYQKEIGVHPGDPEQHKVNFRGVGLTGDMFMGDGIGLTDIVMGLMGSNLGYGSFAIPADLLSEVPDQYLPDVLFNKEGGRRVIATPIASLTEETYLVEFADKNEARALLRRAANDQAAADVNSAYVTQFGSNSLVIDDIKTSFTKVVLWALAVIGGIAIVILSSMVGRTVSEGRRESAVFRAIGAKRSDIAAIYSSYAFLLSLRIVVFALVLGGIIALAVEFLGSESATVGARLAYAANDTSLEFHLFSAMSWYVPMIIAAIVVAGMLASVIPIARSARRNPINDMRDDT